MEFVAPPGTVEAWDTIRLPIMWLQTLFWVRTEIGNDGALLLRQVSIHEYTGEIEVLVTSNIDLDLSCSIAPIYKAGTSEPVIPGDYSCSVTPSSLAAPGGKITVQATVKNAEISGTVGCQSVALVTVTVRPKVTWQQMAALWEEAGAE